MIGRQILRSGGKLTSVHGTGICYQAAMVLIAAIVLVAASATASADTLFWEDFNGYTSFPSENPPGDPVNLGLPQVSEGADEIWCGGRFEAPDSGTIDSDLAVQKVGGGTPSNSTPVGRAEDDAGLLFHVSTLNLEDATLEFDWRTFLADTGDRLKVGYYIGTLTFDANRFHDWYADFGQVGAENWWANSWTQLLSASANNNFTHQSYPLPIGEADIWIAFWLDNGEGDFAKIDNVNVYGTPVIPEPSTWLLGVMGACGCLALRRRIAARARRFMG
jgi:hypothetical protein